MDKLTPAERLIVAADFKPDEQGLSGIQAQVRKLARELQGLGVIVKVNSALRSIGYGLIEELHSLGLKVFADLKLNDIPETMETDARILALAKPEIVTVMCSAGVDGLSAVQKVLGPVGTEVLGVTVLTSFSEEECQAVFTCSTKAGVLRFARMAQLAGLGGLILSSKDAEFLSKCRELHLTFNTPAIRPSWSIVPGDDQNPDKIMTPTKAIQAGVKRLVIGRPITGTKPNDKGMPQSPREAVERTLTEIAEAFSA